MEVIITMLLFYVVSAFTGHWLYANRGEYYTSGHYTVKKMMPWTMGYVLTCITIRQSYRGWITNYSPVTVWLFYAFFFALMVTLYRLLMRFVRDFQIFEHDLDPRSPNNFVSWLLQRREFKQNYFEIFGKGEQIAIDVNVLGYFIFAMFFATILVLFTVI